MTDKQVDYFLKELEKTQYKISTFDKDVDIKNFDAQKVFDTMNKSFHIMYLIQELKLIRDLQEIGNTSIYGLTKKGRKVVRLGGWLKYLERESDLEIRKERKENAEIKLTEFKVKTGMFPYYVAFASFIISITSLVKSCNNEKAHEKQLKKTQSYKEGKTTLQNQKELKRTKNIDSLNKK
jgi:hypothetical protein